MQRSGLGPIKTQLSTRCYLVSIEGGLGKGSSEPTVNADGSRVSDVRAPISPQEKLGTYGSE